MSRMGRQQSHASGLNSNNSHQKPGRFSLWPGRRSNATTTKEESTILSSSGLMIDPPHSDLIVNSPVILPEIELTRPNLSQDLFIGASNDPNYIKLQENVRRLRRAPGGPEPKNVDAVWEVYKRQREESSELCRKLIEKSQEHHHARNPSFESSIGPLDTRSSLSSESINDASLPFQINNQWLSAIRDYKAFQETLLNTLHTSLVVTYTTFEPDASQRQLEIFLADKEHRKSVITKWRYTSVRRVRSEKPEFFEKYKIRSLNFDKLKHDIEESESLFETGHTPNRGVCESVIYKNGDTILEFANRPSDSLPIIRFRVSSHFLSPDEVSPLFSQMLCPEPMTPLDMMNDLPKAPSRIIGKDGIGVNVYRMPQMEPNNHEALALLLHAIHGHTERLPRDDIDFPVFVSIADVCLRYRCTSPVELQVEYRWLPQWESRAAESNPEELLLIAYTFGARDLFTRVSRSIILNAKDDDDTQGTELWPQAIKDTIRTRRAIYMEQILDYCTSVINEYLQPPRQNTERPVHVGSLELSTVRCPRKSYICDATNLGWLMLFYNELGVSPLSPKRSSKRSLKELIDCLRFMSSPPQTHIGVCDFAPNFRNKINDISNTIIGLTLHDVRPGQHGWALSKGKGPQNMASEEIFELPAQVNTKECIVEAEKAKEATRTAVSLRILSLLDNLEDLHAAAMIDKTFYNTYIKNEVRLLRNIVKAGLKHTSFAAEAQASPTSQTLPDTTDSLEATAIDLIDDSDSGVSSISGNRSFAAQDEDLYDVSPPLSPIDISAMPMPTSEEEARELLARNVEATSRAWATRNGLPPVERNLNSARSEKFLAGPLERYAGSSQNEKFLVGDIAHLKDKIRNGMEQVSNFPNYDSFGNSLQTVSSNVDVAGVKLSHMSNESGISSGSNSDLEEPQSMFGRNRNKLVEQDHCLEPGSSGFKFGLRAQLGRPRGYFESLINLKSEVFENSALNTIAQKQPNQPFSAPPILRPEVEMLLRSQKAAIGVDYDYRDFVFGPDQSITKNTLIAMLESYNILRFALVNILRLKCANFIDSHITVFVADHTRSNVANTVSIYVEEVTQLVLHFKTTVETIYSDPNSLSEAGSEVISELTNTSNSYLSKLGLSIGKYTEETVSWYSLASTIDLAVLVYVSAQLEDLDSCLFETSTEIVTNVPRFPNIVSLGRYGTSCLNNFLRQDVWVFHCQSHAVNAPLYLSLRIDEFADFWGPVWQIAQTDTDTSVHSYAAGDGYIVPWLHDMTTHPPLKSEERLCHWVPGGDNVRYSLSQTEQQSLGLSDFSKKEISSSSGEKYYNNVQPLGAAFNGRERLLIGAGPRRKHHPMKWTRCYCNIQEIEGKLRGMQRLHQLGASESYSEVDARTMSLVGGHFGLSLGGSATIKRVQGVSFKKVFMEFWEKQPGAQDPSDLANRWGVAISLCTMNAERLSLFELLNTPSIRRFISRFNWSESECKSRFLDALDSGVLENLNNLWLSKREWQEEMGKVLSMCLQALSSTGLDSKRQTFSALWVPPETTLPKHILLKPSEHSWTKFLKDSVDSFTVAVVVEDCLGTKFGTMGRRSCGAQEIGSVLQTSICVNDEIDPSHQLIRREGSQPWGFVWDVSQLERGTCFPLGTQGRLKTIEKISNSRLLLEWDLVWSQVLREKVGIQRREKPSHWEYTEPVGVQVRPIPVYLLSSIERE